MELVRPVTVPRFTAAPCSLMWEVDQMADTHMLHVHWTLARFGQWEAPAGSWREEEWGEGIHSFTFLPVWSLQLAVFLN